MACGTGKTFTALRIAESLQARTILFAAPAIALVAQARREWMRQSAAALHCQIVCSDSGAGKSATEDATDLLSLDCPVTSDPKMIARFLAPGTPDTPPGTPPTPRVIFCTYHSLDKIVTAQKEHGAGEFALAIIDEAHRTTGAESPPDTRTHRTFQTIHGDNNIRIARRLYMTATPKIYTAASKQKITQKGLAVYDMSDETIYGPLLYHLKFRDAIAKTATEDTPMLCDYRVIVLFVPQTDITQATRDRLRTIARDQITRRKKSAGDLERLIDKHITRAYGALLAINGEIIAPTAAEQPATLSRAIGFANTVANSQFYAAILQDPALQERLARGLPPGKPPVTLAAEHLDAKKNATARDDALYRLKTTGDNQSHILCNVGLFKEGIDVPTLDAVLFFEPRQSQVDVVQAVGRVMRRAAGKKFGYIIIPAAVPDTDYDIDKLIEKDEEGFAAIFQTLRALQSHDERLQESTAAMILPAVVKPPVTDSDDPTKVAEKNTVYADQTPPPAHQLEFLNLRAEKLGKLTDNILTHIVQKSGLGSAGKLAADDIEHTVKSAAKLFYNAGAAPALATAMGDSIDPKNPQEEKERLERAACTIAALLMANACLLHRRLAALPSMTDLVGLSAFGAAPNPIAHLRDEWQTILRRDYKPIFHPALAVLNALPPATLACDQAIRRIAECADNVADSLSELGYDHAGPLYHRILGTAESDGAFYTTNPAALLLAKLALPADFTDWTNPQKARDLKIMDPACGTGTLLMAAMKTIKERVRTARDLTPADEKTLHRHLVENSLCGLDINHQAVQIAASNLTLGAPDVDYRQMHLYAMKHGITDEGPKAGSLELLTGDALSLFTRTHNTLKNDDATQINDSDKQAAFPVRDLDMIIMNPPFSNNTKRAAKLSSQDKARMQAHERQMKNDVATRHGKLAANTINSNAAATFFTPLAEIALRKDSGTLAMVQPFTSCTGAAALPQRQFLAHHFHIERIVTSHAHSGHNFSGNTGIHECLIIARRQNAGGGGDVKNSTQFVVLRKNPKNSEDVNNLVEAIKNNDLGDWGQIHTWPADKMRAGDWSPVQWYDGTLVQIIQTIKQNPHLSRLDKFHKIGPVGQAIRVAFEQCEPTDTKAVPIFWSKSTKLHHTIYAECNEHGKPKHGKESTAAKLLQNGGNCLITVRVDTRSGFLTSIYSPVPAIGSGWIPIITDTQAQAMALSVWWNSTIVWLMLLNNRGTLLTWPMFSAEHLRAMPIPDLNNPTNVATLADAYDKVRRMPMPRLSQSANDPTRDIIDEAAAKAAQIPIETLRHWRRLLSQEPTITPQKTPPPTH